MLWLLLGMLLLLHCGMRVEADGHLVLANEKHAGAAAGHAVGMLWVCCRHAVAVAVVAAAGHAVAVALQHAGAAAGQSVLAIVEHAAAAAVAAAAVAAAAAAIAADHSVQTPAVQAVAAAEHAMVAVAAPDQLQAWSGTMVGLIPARVWVHDVGVPVLPSAAVCQPSPAVAVQCCHHGEAVETVVHSAAVERQPLDLLPALQTLTGQMSPAVGVVTH